jgi:hypothetical protein
MDVAEWLQGLGLERYAPAFRDNEIDWDALPKVSAEDLKDLGVVLGGHRRKPPEGQLHGGEGDEGGEGFREFLEILGETPVGRIGTSYATPATAMHGTEHGGSQNMVRSSPL